jgi:Zn-dependent protease
MRKKIYFPRREILELLKAWIALSIAFTILLAPRLDTTIIIFFGIATATAGLAFLLHELAHKIVAQRYGHSAEFKANNSMLLLAIGMSFLGFILAAPGAVYIHGIITRQENGIISAAGPLTNLALALTFMPIAFLATGIIGLFGVYGFLINSWLGLFNMIPTIPFDGGKIIKWNKAVYGFMVAALLGLTLLAFFSFMA